MATATETPTRPRKKRWGWGKRILVALLALLLILVLVGAVLMIWKPWAPEIEVADPAQGGQRITHNGMVANYYPSATPGQQPTVMVVGGSEGGLHPGVDRIARALHEEGYTTLALSYWGAEGQPQSLEQVPLETFTTGFDWLKQQPAVDPDKLALIGTSKGGEAAMLMAARDPELKAVVGYVPSNVVWAGVNMREIWTTFAGDVDSSWSQDGRPLPHLPYDTENFRGGELADLYAASLQKLPEHQDAIIPVENSKAPILLICGEADTMWPSCPMSQNVKQRAQENGGPSVTVLAYPDAGHFISGPPVGADSTVDLSQMGGTQEGGEAALQDSWPQVLTFLQTNLD